MTGIELSSYFMTVFAIAIAPGPVVLMLLVRAASRDTSGAAWFGFGYATGGVLIISAVCFGLGAWLTAVPEIFEYSKYVLITYICYTAWGIWKGGFDMNGSCDVASKPALSSFAAGIMTCGISPYMMILFPLVLPELMDITVIKMPDFLIVCVATFLALAVASGLVIGFASQLRRVVTSPRSAQIMNRVLAIALVTVGGGMALT